MSLIDSAKRELVKYDAEDQDAVIDIMERFFKQWDSGGAVSVMVPVLDRLLRGLPLSALTGADDEWMCGQGLDDTRQNLRCSSVLKAGGGGKPYDIDNPSWDGTFPYMP